MITKFNVENYKFFANFVSAILHTTPRIF